jgi:hypothetical protein
LSRATVLGAPEGAFSWRLAGGSCGKLGFEFGRDAPNSESIRLLSNGSKMIGLACSKDTIMTARLMLASTNGDHVSRTSRAFLEFESVLRRRATITGGGDVSSEYQCVLEDARGGVFRKSIVEAALSRAIKLLVLET